MPEPCPSQERWKEHLDGTLPLDEQAVLTEHLDGCADCRKTLETLAGGSDSLLDLARQAGEATDASTPALHEVLAKFQTPPSETQAEPAGARDDSLSFLMPSEKPGCLGRLGHYEVQEVIGKGGFGIVLKAFDEKLHRVVAIKVLSPAYAAIGSARKRFIREAQSAAAVKNEHVVAIYSVQDEAQPPYLVMELIDGISLQDKLDKKGTLSLREILRIGLQTAEGLTAAHKQGLVHRDIKPANILLENGVERVKITDFGLARAVDDASMTQSGTVAGTPMYMSPEQAEGLPIDHRSDLFSLGTVLYAMCTGHSPFRASGTHAVLKRVIDASPRPIREINNEIPDWLEAITAKLHARKPDDRVQSAKEVADLLGAKLADVQAGRAASDPSAAPAAIAPPPFAQVPSPRWRGWPLGAAVVIAALLLIVALAPRDYFSGTTLLLFFRNQGELHVQTDDPEMVVTITHGGEVTHDGTNLRDFVLSAGVYRVKVGFRGKEAFLTKDVEIPRGGQETLDVTRELAAAADRIRKNTPDRLGPIIKALRDFDQEPGWVQLFNGKDLTGWKTHPEQPGIWTVEAGELVGSTGNGPISHLYTTRGDFTNFHLRAEVKINRDRDSGIHFHCTPYPEFDLKPSGGRGKQPLGYEANIAKSTATTGGTGSIWRLDAEGKLFHRLGRDVPIEANTWFVLEIVMEGNHIVTKVNGKIVDDFRDEGGPAKGHFVLEAMYAPTTVYFKKVEIKELLPEEPGWVQLFNGKDLTGWQTHPDQPGDWRVDHEGHLVCTSGANVSHLFYMPKEFANFHLRAVVKINQPGDSGLCFRCRYDPLVAVNSPIKDQPNGYEAQIRDIQLGMIIDISEGKAPAFLSQGTPVAADAWALLEVIANGNRITSKVNGNLVKEITSDSHTRGRIAVQHANVKTAVHFKKIEIKELPPSRLFDD